MWEIIRCPGNYLYGLGLVEFLSGSHVVQKQLREHSISYIQRKVDSK